jgi:hypothetical protein
VIDAPAWGRRLRWRASSHLADHHLFLAANRLDRNRAVVHRRTELVIEGFPRSANTFAAVAFQVAQPRPVRLAHHLHAQSQVTWALQAGIPALVVIREPSAAAASVVTRSPHLTLSDVLSAYARFYESLLPHRDACVLGLFDSVTTDFGAVIRELNARADTHFEPFEHNDVNTADVYGLIELRTSQPALARAVDRFTSGALTRQALDAVRRQTRPGQARVPEHRVARPSALRADRLAALAEKIRSPEFAAEYGRARAVFSAFTGGG